MSISPMDDRLQRSKKEDATPLLYSYIERCGESTLSAYPSGQVML